MEKNIPKEGRKRRKKIQRTDGTNRKKEHDGRLKPIDIHNHIKCKRSNPE